MCEDIIALKPDLVFTEKGVSGKYLGNFFCERVQCNNYVGVLHLVVHRMCIVDVATAVWLIKLHSFSILTRLYTCTMQTLHNTSW